MRLVIVVIIMLFSVMQLQDPVILIMVVINALAYILITYMLHFQVVPIFNMYLVII